MVKIAQDSTWGWRKILKLREEARTFIKFEVGRSKKKNLWHDWWHPNGILYKKCGLRAIYDATSNFNAKVSSALQGKSWIWKDQAI